jgi:hypothetical protein
MATIGGQHTPDSFYFRRGLSKELEKLVWRYGKWNKFTDIIDVKKYKEAGTFAGSMSLPAPKNLITVVKDFEREGGIYMDTPVLVPLTGRGKVGTARLKGSEETRKILNKKVAVNQLRHGVQIQDNKMSKQMLKKPQVQMALMERGMQDLQDWFSRRLAMFPYQAILGNYSDNLTDPDYGLNVSIASHPNLYVSGYGKVPFSNVFNADYETAVANALATLVDDADHHFKMQSIRDMCYLANFHKVQKLNIKGHLAYPIFIPPALAWQLAQDNEFQEFAKFAQNRGDTNWAWTGELDGIFIDQAFLIVDDYVPAARISGDDGYDSTLGTVNYGLANYMENPRDNGSRKPAILCGAGAVACGYGSELSFASEDDDYKQWLADGADMIVGMQRSDIIDDDNYFGNGAHAFYENSSSIVEFFYANDELDLSTGS